MHFLFFLLPPPTAVHRPPLSTAHRCPPSTAVHRPLPTAHRCPPLSAAVSVSVAAAVSVVSVVSARLRPSPPVLACPRLSTTRPRLSTTRPRPRRFLHSPSLSAPSSPSPLPLPLIFPSLRPLFIPVYPCFTPVYSCLFLSVSLSFYAPAFLALSFRPVRLVSGQFVHVRSFISFFFAILSEPPS